MSNGSDRCSVFVNYRREDTGWAANVLADALRRRLDPISEVFLDNRSIALGQAFAKVLKDGVRRSAVLVALIGPRWDVPPLLDGLADPEDWVCAEILLARDHAATVVPVLVDRDQPPRTAALPTQLHFLPGLQLTRVRQDDDRSPDVFADRIAGLLPSSCTSPVAPTDAGAARTRRALDGFLRSHLPPAQQWSGNRDRLVDLALAVLGRDDRLVFLSPANIHGRPRGSASVLLTATDMIVVEVAEDFSIIGEVRFPRRLVERVEVAPTRMFFADAVVHTRAGDEIRFRFEGLFRDQARQLADHLRS